MNAPVHLPPATRTTCPYCGVGCGVLARPGPSGSTVIAGDPDHPANFGRLCSKGFALDETLGLGGRLLHPMLRRADGSHGRVDWDTALAAVADGFRRIVERDGPDAIAFYLSGQLLTEDYYVANKLMKGFLGSANVDTNSRLCMASTVAGHRRAFGEDVVPGNYDDLDHADLLVLVGSNTAWCHPVLFQRMVRNRRERGARLVVIDPRRTVTADEADLFLPIAPGTDTALFCGLLVHLAEAGALDRAYIDAHTNGFSGALARARTIAPDTAATAAATGLDEGDVARFFELFRARAKAVTCFSQGVNQSAQGTDKVNAIINCHLATGRIGRPGMGPFSLTGQPNAMGGREVGGLANQLAAHMGFSPAEVDRVRRFWNAPNMAEHEGLKAVQMFEAIEQGTIKAIWVIATNPAVSLPRAGAMLAALKRLELFVVSDNVLQNDTIAASPHVLLPAAAWGEKDGTVTNSERRVSRQRAFLPLPGEARPDWWIVTEVARHLGFGDAFCYRSAADVFREHAALSAFENNGARVFDIGGLAAISDDEYKTLDPVQWPVRANNPDSSTRLFASGGFSTPDRKARFIAPEPPALREPTSAEYPLRLNTGRLRDQWHSMTRTGQSPRLAAHVSEPSVEVHPDDARAAGLTEGGFARVSTAHGSCVLKVAVSNSQQPGSIFVPIHWSAQTASSARVGDLISACTDPHSGQPESKATPAALALVEFSTHGIARTREPITWPNGTWWTRVAASNGIEYRLAANHGPLVWHDFAYRLLDPDARLTDRLDSATGSYCAAGFVDDDLQAWLCVGPANTPLPTDMLRGLRPEQEIATAIQHRVDALVLMTSAPVVCACFSVGADAIREAAAAGAGTVEQIGQLLHAGTNCGSCLPELRRIIARERRTHAH